MTRSGLPLPVLLLVGRSVLVCTSSLPSCTENGDGRSCPAWESQYGRLAPPIPPLLGAENHCFRANQCHRATEELATSFMQDAYSKRKASLHHLERILLQSTGKVGEKDGSDRFNVELNLSNSSARFNVELNLSNSSARDDIAPASATGNATSRKFEVEAAVPRLHEVFREAGEAIRSDVVRRRFLEVMHASVLGALANARGPSTGTVVFNVATVGLVLAGVIVAGAAVAYAMNLGSRSPGMRARNEVPDMGPRSQPAWAPSRMPSPALVRRHHEAAASPQMTAPSPARSPRRSPMAAQSPRRAATSSISHAPSPARSPRRSPMAAQSPRQGTAGTGSARSNLPLPTSTRSATLMAQPQDLCPDLVVPEENECVLLLPWLGEGFGAKEDKVTINIGDMRGTLVFHGELRSKLRQIVLSSATSQMTFASAVAGDKKTHSQRAYVTIRGRDHAPFGGLQYQGQGDRGTFVYAVVGAEGWPIKFNVTPNRGGATVSDKDGQQLAVAQPGLQGSEYYQVRIGPLVDVGLIVLCMLNIDVLEREAIDVP